MKLMIVIQILKKKFYRHLQLKINEHPLFKITEHETPVELAESKTRLPNLSDEARRLLKEASQGPHGTILYIRYIGGTDLQTNGKNIILSSERRIIAKWDQALNELISQGLVVNRGKKGEVFELSSLGYQVADMIAL